MWLDGDGVLSARVLEGVASTPREAYVLPSSGGIVGHCWNLGLDRILGPVAETADARKAADGRVSNLLEQIGDELDEIRDGAEVHSATGMQSVLVTVLRLLAGVALDDDAPARGAAACGRRSTPLTPARAISPRGPYIHGGIPGVQGQDRAAGGGGRARPAHVARPPLPQPL